MIAIFLSLVALAAAAPQYGHRSHYHRQRDFDFGESLFDADKFWKELESELRQVDEAIKELTEQFPVTTSFNEGVEGNEYKLTIRLTGFEEKDITVKAKEGVLMIQAVHNTHEGNQKSYIDMRTLPSNINVAGSWTYENNVLKIVFPLNKKTDEEVTTEVHQEEHTIAPGSREEMEEHGKEDVDADVGLTEDKNRGEVETNEISNNDIEATTYAVDLKNEVEFVPMKYKK